ncbi:7164_t:CDS:2, partial [Gigaspora rosea]
SSLLSVLKQEIAMYTAIKDSQILEEAIEVAKQDSRKKLEDDIAALPQKMQQISINYASFTMAIANQD